MAIFLLLLFSAPLFFFKLGATSLTSWDEAWYASIARDFLENPDILRIFWNGSRFVDHPTLGPVLIAVNFLLMGISEFSARFSGAVSGLATLGVLYLLGKELFNRPVGFLAALALLSSPWFLYRARSGNLDIPLVFFFVLSFYLAVKASKEKKFLLTMSVSLSLLFLTKLVIGFTIVPSVIYIFWKSKIPHKLVLKYFLISLTPFSIWFLIQLLEVSGFLERFLQISAPGVAVQSSLVENLKLFKLYLHSGIGRWFWPTVLVIFLALLLKVRKAYPIVLFALMFSLPFLFSPKGQIWHLIPLFPFLVLNLVGVGHIVIQKLFKDTVVVFLLLSVPIVFVASGQIIRNWNEFVDIEGYVSDEAILSLEAGKYMEKFYIDDDFDPVAAFYSGREVEQILTGTLENLFNGDEPFVLITYQWRLDQSGIKENQYKVLKKDRDKILLLKE